MKQATLGYLIERFERLDPDKSVRFDFVYFKPDPKRVHSYRGYYEQLALGYSDDGDPTVAQVLESLRNADGNTFTGYKGGEYTMHPGTHVWVANHNESGGTAVVDVRDDGWVVTIITACVD